jgi:tocopherol cyclase
LAIRKKIRSLFNPSIYQGWGNKKRYFEGWYFKVVNASETKAFAFIPGIAMEESGVSHAFVQLLDGKEKRSDYFSYDTTSFVPSDKKFELSIENNYFSADGIRLDLPNVTGSLNFSGVVPWPNHWYSPGIMGPYTFVPFMECNHGIVSMDHSLSGSLTVNGEVIDFTGGRGYIEKDWGHSFPSAYIWMQSNHFSSPGISFKASVARIPWVTGNFTGFIAGLWLGDRLYQFTKYSGTRLSRLSVTNSTVELEFTNRSGIINISAPVDRTTSLASPVKGLMGGRIEESMTSTISLTLSERNTRQIIYSGEGRNASIEVSGDMQTLFPH